MPHPSIPCCIGLSASYGFDVGGFELELQLSLHMAYVLGFPLFCARQEAVLFCRPRSGLTEYWR